MNNSNNKMVVEIWSDVVCPFCFLGKRKFEQALERFSFKDSIEVQWKSFQLNPVVETDPTMSVYEYLSKTKGISHDVALQMTEQIAARGKEVGIDYHFEKTKVNNTFKAHCFLHFAADKGKQNEAKEILLKAYFTQGKNVDDLQLLLDLGEQLAFNRTELEDALSGNKYLNAVNSDMELARNFGISGVPFFVFDRKYAVSGAQETTAFLQTLEKSFEEWRVNTQNQILNVVDGETCSPDTECN
jgi:predicted DsbA family dithiol-disulfide isomerase